MSHKVLARSLKFFTSLAAFAVVSSGCTPISMQASDPVNLNYEGLNPVDARDFDVALVRPGVEFTSYKGLLIDKPALEFRTPDRTKQQFPLSREQKTLFRDMLDEKFRSELKTESRLQLVDESGSDVLKLKIRVQNIVATVPPRAATGVGSTGFALEAVGEATLVLELRDSESEEVLARAANVRAIEGTAILQKGGPLTRWPEIEKLGERWASSARKSLDTLIKEF